MFDSYQRAYEKLLSLANLQVRYQERSKQDLEQSLRRTKGLLAHLGNPEKSLKFIHITGTSGKGSVAKMMHDVLRHDKRTVGTYTSPHTTTYLERFMTNDCLIDPEILADNIEDVIRHYEHFLAEGHAPLSFFELSVCIALYSFVQAGLEWAIIEVGCGGRYDASNVIPAPVISVITNIDKDHTQIIGPTLKDIAYEKAGIIKEGSVVFCGESRPAIRKIFMQEAIAQDAALFFVNPPGDHLINTIPGLHQQHNAAIVYSAARELGIDDEIIIGGLQRVTLLPCRYERIQERPTVILDGAHSPAKMKRTCEMLAKEGRRIHVVAGFGSSKDSKSMLKQLVPVATTITLTRTSAGVSKTANPFQLLKYVPESQHPMAFLDANDAIDHAIENASDGDIVCITGSLYLAGELRERWISEDQILLSRSSFGTAPMFDKYIQLPA